MTQNLHSAGAFAVPAPLFAEPSLDRALDALWALAADGACAADPLAFLFAEAWGWPGIELKHVNPPLADAQSVGDAKLPSAQAEPSVLVAQSTRRMLAQMRAVLDRESARLGEDGMEGKAAVDQVALIARTLEKIDQMERLIAEDLARAAAQTLSSDEREELRQTVRTLIIAAAERMVAGREAQAAVDCEAGESGAGECDGVSVVGEAFSGPADDGRLDPGSSPG